MAKSKNGSGSRPDRLVVLLTPVRSDYRGNEKQNGKYITLWGFGTEGDQPIMVMSRGEAGELTGNLARLLGDLDL
jgi:hypothetical protein